MPDESRLQVRRDDAENTWADVGNKEGNEAVPVTLTDPIDIVNICGGLVPRGEYDEATDYTVGDAVTYLGASYVQFVDAPAATLPTDTDYWMILAEKGDTGSSIVSGEFVADDLVFTKDDASTVTIADAKIDLKGETGEAGAAATIAVGTVATGLAGSSVIVTNSGSSSAATFNFTIPKGDTGNAGTNGINGTDGADGAPSTIVVGSTTTGMPGTDASVSNSGNPTDAVLEFVIPRGNTGATGANGTDGTDGADGQGITPQAVGFTLTGGTTPKTLTVALDANVAGTNTGDNAVNSNYSGLTQYTDEMAQDAVGNAVGNGLDYTDATGEIKVDESELDHGTLGGLSDDDHPQYLSKTQYADIYRQGFTNLTETSISFDGTNTFTLTGTNWTYYRAGIKYTIATSKTVDLAVSPPATAGEYFIYIDSTTGVLTASTVAWSLLDTKVPVATINWDNALTPKYWIADERHTTLIDQKMQYYLHKTDGCKPLSIPSITGSYTLNSGTDANKTFGLSAGSLLDQDLKHDPALLAEGDGTTTPYVVWYRVSASVWNWKYSDMPFVYNVGNTDNIIQRDNGGTMTNTTVGVGAGKRYSNSYILMSNKTGDARYIIIPGRAEYSSVALAQAEAITAFTWTGFNIDESVICYRCTWGAVAASGKGSAQLAANPQLVNISTVTNASSGAGTDHNTLTNLQGGTTDEYYHLTAAELAVVAATSGTNTGDSASLPIGGGTVTGDIVLAESTSVRLDPSLSADEKWSGITIPGTAGATLSVGDLCYLDVTATEWLLADADAAATSGSVVLALCVLASTDGQPTTLLLNGTIRSAAFPASIALGAPVYVDTTAGEITATQPSGTDDVIRVVGWAVTVEPNTIYFNPSPDYMTHT